MSSSIRPIWAARSAVWYCPDWQKAPEGTILLVQGPGLLTGEVGVPLKQPDEIGFGVLKPTPPSPLKHAQQHAQHRPNGPGRQKERELALLLDNGALLRVDHGEAVGPQRL